MKAMRVESEAFWVAAAIPLSRFSFLGAGHAPAGLGVDD